MGRQTFDLQLYYIIIEIYESLVIYNNRFIHKLDKPK